MCLAKRTVTQLYNQATIQGETAERRAAAPERGTNKTKQKTYKKKTKWWLNKEKCNLDSEQSLHQIIKRNNDEGKSK